MTSPAAEKAIRLAGSRQWLVPVLALVLAASVIAGPTALAADAAYAPVPVDAQSERIGLAEHALYLEDPEGRYTRNTLPGPGQWQRTRAPVPNFGFTRSVYWFRVAVHNHTSGRLERLLEVGVPLHDDIRIASYQGETTLAEYHLGDTQPYSARPFKTRQFIVPLTLPADSTTEILVRVRTKTAMQLPLVLWQTGALIGEHPGHGIFYGVMFALMAYLFLVYMTVRQRSYLYLLLFVTSFAAMHATIEGYGFRYLWPEWIWWQQRAAPALVCFGAIMLCGFTLRTLRLRDNLWSAALIGLGIGAGVLLGMVLTFPDALVFALPVGLFMVIALTALAAGIFLWARGDRVARDFTLAWAIFIAGAIVLGLNRLGIIPRNPLTESATQIGAIAQVVLFTFLGLGNAFVTLRSERERERLAATRDVLTGLPNRRLFEDRLTHALDRARSRGRTMAVLFIDLNDFKDVNDRYGHAAGDDVLRGVADLLVETLRSGDTVARYGGDEFTVVLEDLDDPRDASRVADKLHKAFRKPLQAGNRLVPQRLSIGVSVFPEDGADAVALLASADAAMYEAKVAARARRDTTA